ncbi:FAD binding domain-containing protein [Hirsutella rhossiliensis]|uniref:FAD binding domain-containing protein n=1 Tax=Hirsutella rhossiliensis TaxID=111463 RepID=A0A9P8SK95_9HYPO|nr:FAD binding domain-containing protein [Hirsutella rhossiliensis]KAH0965014.1 FAD binding domain-containing protein [Hirsutella rhossiliensis]
MSGAKQFKVAIVGGGIGGLTLAVGLLRRGVQVQVYEAAAALGETGLGLSIGPAAQRILPLIDARIREAFDSLVTTHADSPGFERFRQTWFEFVWASGTRAGEVLLDLESPPTGQTTLRRTDLLDALISLLPPESVRLGKRLRTVEETPGAGPRLLFQDGSSVTADIVVGCDGIHSCVRPAVLPHDEALRCRPRYSGMYAYRAVLDMQTAIRAVGERRARVATLYIGKGAYALTYPVMRAQKVNTGLYTYGKTWKDDDAWIRPVSRAVMERDFAHMGPLVNALIKYMPDTSQWAIFELDHVSTVCKSRVAIMGDAAHASTPHQGVGAGQAIEDAHVLTELLSDPSVTTPAHAEAALRAYDAVRLPRAQRAASTSKENAELLCLCREGVGDDGAKLTQEWRQRFRWLWDIDVQQQVQDARGVMLEILAAADFDGLPCGEAPRAI